MPMVTPSNDSRVRNLLPQSSRSDITTESLKILNHNCIDKANVNHGVTIKSTNCGILLLSLPRCMKVFRTVSIVLMASFLFACAQTQAQPANDSTKAPEKKEEGFNAREVIMGHIMDSHEWHFFSIKKEDGTEMAAKIDLPLIMYTPGKGMSMFSFGKMEDGKAHCDGFMMNGEHQMVREDGASFYDISLSKNVIQLIISAILMLWIFLSVAKAYKKRGENAAPKGFQNAIETIIVFIRDEVAKPMLGDKTNRYLPYLLTVFFFIWINNLLGLIPGSANVTGNIAITLTLALFTFIIMIFSSNKHYWGHIFNPPGVPGFVKPILVLIEFLSVLIKPVSLTIRLFANMIAGHLIILSFISLIFIFGGMSIWGGIGISPLSLGFAVFINVLELLVAVLQAFIFTMLSALFIGEAANAGHHHDTHDGLHDEEVAL